MAKILIVDDNEAVRTALRLLLKGAGHVALGASSPEEGMALARAETPDAAVVDMNFRRDTTSGAEGIELLRTLRAEAPELPVVMLTAWGTVDRAVEAMKLGAADYLTKPWDNARMVSAIETQLRLRATRREAAPPRREALPAAADFSDVVGRSPAMLEVLRLVADVAPTEATILLTGESGTGKGLVAEVIHRNGARRERPFVKVHVGALPGSLFEAELFGHVRGAFTDAREAREGRFAAADGGTLFLDEIGTIGPAEQVKLLRVLQDGEFEPVGSDRTRKVDARVLAATNLDLLAAMKEGRFREDLYYRLNVVEIRVPPLRQRGDDVIVLAERFLERFAEKNRREVEGFGARAYAALRAHTWPGNVRELENAIERAVILCRGKVIEPEHLPGGIAAGAPAGAAAGTGPGADAATGPGTGTLPGTPTGPGPAAAAGTATAAGKAGAEAATVDMRELAPSGTLDDLEREAIVRAMRQHGNVIARVAAALGLSRAALYRRLEKYGLREAGGA